MPTKPPGPAPNKEPFDVAVAMRRIREAVRGYPPAAMFDLEERGFGTLFQQLVGCILSIRTRDEVTLPVALRLFEAAASPEAMARLTPARIDTLIHDVSFHEAKAGQIHEIARRAMAEYDGELPCDEAVLTSFRGVGPKCAHLALGVACDLPFLSVDIHVHRVTNRWGIVAEPTPEKTMEALEEVLPRKYWVELNRLLVPFGKHICTGRLPRCTTCPVLDMCEQVGVTEYR